MALDFDDLQAIRECCRDETALKRLQEILLSFRLAVDRQSVSNRSLTRYEAILNLLPDRVFLVNRNGDNLDFKGSQEDTDSGVGPETIIGTNLKQFLPPDVAQRCLEAIANALNSGEPQTLEYQIPAAWGPNAGEMREYEVRLVVSGDEEVLAIERDITERKQSEAALHHSEANHRALLNAVPDLMFRIRRDGVYLDVKSEHDGDLLVPPDEMLGRTVYDILPPEIAMQGMHYVQQALQTGAMQVFDYCLLLQGELRHYEARVVVSGLDEVLVIVRDMTDLKRALLQQAELYQQVQALNASLEQQVQERTAELQQKMYELQQLSQLKDDFLHAVSHDLRTPLMGMLLVLKNLQNKPGESVPLSRPVLERMVQSGERQLEMIHSLLEADSSDIHGVHLQCQPIDFAVLVRSVAEELEPLLGEHQASLVNQITLSLPSVTVDPEQIRRVFENLITNALKHNPHGIHVTLRAVVEDDWLRCSIQDNGIGMTQSDCNLLFERYVRGIHARRSTGVGLGLYLCRQIITAHGGQIGATSAVGTGATFWFTLPLVNSV